MMPDTVGSLARAGQGHRKVNVGEHQIDKTILDQARCIYFPSCTNVGQVLDPNEHINLTV